MCLSSKFQVKSLDKTPSRFDTRSDPAVLSRLVVAERALMLTVFGRLVGTCGFVMLVVTSASLVVTSALLVVTRS